MFIPLRTDSRLRTTPYMNWVLIALNVVVFASQNVNPAWQGAFNLHSRSPTVFQFFSYQFAHADILHIGGNMLFLYIFGNNVNDKMGQLGYLAFYLAGGIVSGLAYVLTETTGASLLGASGSIAAVTGAYLILFPRSHITVAYWWFLIGVYEIQSLFFILGFFALDIFLNFGHQDNVAHVAHIGGTIFGATVCLGLVVTHLLPRDQWDVWALLQRWNKRRQYRDLVAKGYNPFQPTVSGGKNRLPDGVVEQIQNLRTRVAISISEHDLAAAAVTYLQLKELDPQQVMSRTNQTDIATQLYHEQKYPQAAEAYERLLQAYPTMDRVEQIELATGVLYARYLHQYEPAKIHLQKAIARIHDGPQLDLAKAELAIVEQQLLAAPQ